MRKTNLILSLSLGLLLFAGCNKKELDITMKEVVDGDLKITVQNDAGSGISGLVVKLSTGGSVTLEEKTSDANGIVTFNKLLYGSYYIQIENALVGGLEYNVLQPVQVINGVSKEYTIKPSEYSGTATITVVDSWSSEPIAGMNVGIFMSSDQTNSNFDDILDICVRTGITNADGEITFENLPFNVYGAIVYVDNTDFDFDSQVFYIDEKGEEVETRYYY